MENKIVLTKNNFQLKQINGVTYIDNTLIVNKSFSLPTNYGNGLTKELTLNFQKMKNAASKQNFNIFILSGFRSYEYQKKIYENYYTKDNSENVDTYSARPGHSEHQTGLAIDINSINENFTNTKEWQWLSDNSYKYGFILRYPKDKESITGYTYEPWHYRYVGTTLAECCYNNNKWITLEEYFGIDSKYEQANYNFY